MQRIASLALCVVLIPLPAAAVGRGRAKYVGGTLVGIKIGMEAPIDLQDAEKMVFLRKEARIAIPWSTVDAVEYKPTGMARKNRVGLAFASPYTLFFTKRQRHCVTISFKDAQYMPQIAVFEFDRQDIRVALSAIRLRSGKTIACEGEEVGDPIEACAKPVAEEIGVPSSSALAGPIEQTGVPPPPVPVLPMSGPRVRVSAPGISKNPIAGELLASDDATITIRRTHANLLDRTYGKTLRLPRESVTHFERSLRPSQRPLGAGIGLGIGVLVGFLVTCGGNNCSDQGALAAVALGLPAGILGAALAPGERWADESPKRVHVGLRVAPAPGRGVGLSASLGF